MRHDALRDGIANLMREVCTDVRTEPGLIPVNSNSFNPKTSTKDGARLDISACGIQSKFERTFFNVRVSHPHAPSNVTLSLEELYKRNEKEKQEKYEERILQTEKGTFAPLVFLTTGGIGPQCSVVLKRLAELIAKKRKELYSHVMSFIRTKLRFSLLKSVLISNHGVRGKTKKEPKLEGISFNIIPTQTAYDC